MVSNEHSEDLNVATVDHVKFARELHATVRDKAELDECWADASESLRRFYIRMAMRTDARRAEFFRC